MTERLKTTATPEEIAQWVKLGKKIGPMRCNDPGEYPWPGQVFRWWVSRTPGSPSEIALAHPENKRQIFLKWRDDEYFSGWHLPGSFIRQRESWLASIKRIISQEIVKPFNASIEIESWKQIGQFNFHSPKQDPRGHASCTLFLIIPVFNADFVKFKKAIESTPEKTGFFGPDIPKDIMQVKLPPEIATDSSIPNPPCSSHEIMFKAAIATLFHRPDYIKEIKNYQNKFC